MRIVICSDTHGFHYRMKDIPSGDIFVHCGDSTLTGKDYEVNNFLDWLVELPYKYKVFINGNHELGVYRKGNMKSLVSDKNAYQDLFYLENSGVEIEGINFWGSPNTPEFFNWAYMYDRKDAKEVWENIPNNVDFLITHGPPYGYLDIVKPIFQYPDPKAGCKELLSKIKEVKPSVHAFGHIHDSYGLLIPASKSVSETLFVNASICNDSYVIANKPIVIEIDNITKKVTI